MTPGSTLECLPEQRVLARILVVDDDPAILDTVAQILDLEGYRAVTAADGAEALEEIERRRPSLVLLDMRMPVMDGWAFAAELAARGVDVPILVMTAAQDARRWSREVGARGYIEKPFQLDDLIAAVEDALAHE